MSKLHPMIKAIAFAPSELASLTVYADALSAMIVRDANGKEIDGHCFTFEREHSSNGVHRLIAVDSYDGKRYRVTVENVR